MNGTRDSHWRAAPAVVFGMMLVAFGVLALLDGFGVVHLRSMMRLFWPTAIILWGATWVATPGGRRVPGLIVVAAGTVLLGVQLGLWEVRLRMFLPLIPIAIGLKLMFRSTGRRRRQRSEAATGATGEPGNPGAGADRTATIQEVAVLGGIDRKNISQSFQGGQVTAVMGGVELDLRECRMADTEAVIDVFALLGGISLRIPKDWTVDSQIPAFLGGVDDGSDPPVEGTAKRLVLTGTAIFGGVEIKN